ncbi:hypothetical protein SF123566_8537 [Shigella flexneri 1235-66]|nr:hypothetical protein SF123566_8537 [Shigella flexneri 1235-66]
MAKKQHLQVNSFITGKMRRGSRHAGEAAKQFGSVLSVGAYTTKWGCESLFWPTDLHECANL